MTTKTDAGPNKHTHGLTATDAQLAVVTKTVSDLADTLTAVSSLAATSVKEETAARKATDVELLGTINDATQALSTVAGNVTLLDARVAKLERPVTPPPVDPPKPPDIPGPLPTGTTPSKTLRDAAAAGSDCSALLATYFEGSAKKLDLDGITIPFAQYASTTLRDKEIYNGGLKQTKVLVQNGPGKDSSHLWLQTGTGGLWFHDITGTGAYPGRPAGKDGSTLPEEYNGFIRLQGAQSIQLTKMTIQKYGGDGVQVGGWQPSPSPQPADLLVQDSFILDCGRMGIAFTGGAQRVRIVNVTFDRMGWYACPNIEPDGTAVGGKPELYSDFQILACHMGRGNSAKLTMVISNSSNKGGVAPTLAGIVATGNRTMYADTPWRESIYGPWASAYAGKDNK